MVVVVVTMIVLGVTMMMVLGVTVMMVHPIPIHPVGKSSRSALWLFLDVALVYVRYSTESYTN